MRDPQTTGIPNEKALWVRGGRCTLEQKAIHYYGKSDVYNVFDFYFAKSKEREGQKSLYLQFADLSDSSEDICHFSEKYGPLHLAGMLFPENDPSPTEIRRQSRLKVDLSSLRGLCIINRIAGILNIF